MKKSKLNKLRKKRYIIPKERINELLDEIKFDLTEYCGGIEAYQGIKNPYIVIFNLFRSKKYKFSYIEFKIIFSIMAKILFEKNIEKVKQKLIDKCHKHWTDIRKPTLEECFESFKDILINEYNKDYEKLL